MRVAKTGYHLGAVQHADFQLVDPPFAGLQDGELAGGAHSRAAEAVRTRLDAHDVRPFAHHTPSDVVGQVGSGCRRGEIMWQQSAMLAARIANDRLKMPYDGRKSGLRKLVLCTRLATPVANK
jgi:hypothetical protein